MLFLFVTNTQASVGANEVKMAAKAAKRFKGLRVEGGNITGIERLFLKSKESPDAPQVTLDQDVQQELLTYCALMGLVKMFYGIFIMIQGRGDTGTALIHCDTVLGLIMLIKTSHGSETVEMYSVRKWIEEIRNQCRVGLDGLARV
jgi:hypothetical protein